MRIKKKIFAMLMFQVLCRRIFSFLFSVNPCMDDHADMLIYKCCYDRIQSAFYKVERNDHEDRECVPDSVPGYDSHPASASSWKSSYNPAQYILFPQNRR